MRADYLNIDTFKTMKLHLQEKTKNTIHLIYIEDILTVNFLKCTSYFKLLFLNLT